MKLNSKKTYYYLVGGVILLILGIAIFQILEGINESKMPTFVTPQRYLNLFNDVARSKLKQGATYNSKVRNPISTLDYDNEKYSIIVYEFKSGNRISMDDISAIKEYDKIKTTGSVYGTVNQGYFDLMYCSGKPDPVQKIILGYKGEDFRVLKSNDSLTSYYLLYSNLALTYNDKSQADIFWDLGNNQKLIPINIVFYKYTDSVYMIMMTVNNPKSSLDEKLLSSLLK